MKKRPALNKKPLSKKTLNKNRGFSLIEMLITVAIFMVVITGVIRLIPYTLKFQNLSHSQQSERNFRVLLASLNKEACNKTFEGKTVGERVDVIKDESGIILFNRGENGGEFQKNLRIVEIKTRALSDENSLGSAEMVVSYKRTQSLYPTKTGEDGDCTAGGTGGSDESSSVTTGCYTLTCGLRIKKDGALVGAKEGQRIVSDGGRGCSIVDCGGTEGMGGGKPDCYKVTEEGEGGLTLVGCEGAAEAEATPPKNTVFGFRAGKSLTTGPTTDHGTENTFIGYEAGMNNTTGFYNNFVGYQAGLNNNTGFYNNFVGYQAGYSNRSGNYNSFVGTGAGQKNTTGYRNNFFGTWAGAYNTTGNYNNFVGYQAGYSNRSGDNNNFVGYQAGYSNSTGYNNNFVGALAGAYNTNGYNNNFVGTSAGAYNTTGYHNNFVGAQAGQSNTAGSGNNFVGTSAGAYNTTGNNNIAIGNGAGQKNTTGSYNIAIGARSGCYTSSSAVPACASESYKLDIGGLIKGNMSGSKEVTIHGDLDVKGEIKLDGTIIHPSSSDRRLKRKIKDLKKPQLLKLLKLRARSFYWKDKNRDIKKQLGFIAQEVRKEYPELVSEAKDEKKTLRLNYQGLLPVVVSALKELNQVFKEFYQDFKRSYQDFKDALKKLQIEVTNLTVSFKDLIKETKTEFTSLKNSITSIRGELRGLVNSFKAEFTNLKKRFLKMESKALKIETLQGKALKVQGKVLKVQDKVLKVQGKVQLRINSLEKDNKEFKRELSSIKAYNKELKSDLEDLKRELKKNK